MPLGYDYLNARAKGLKARLLDEERLRRLCRARDTEELVSRLAAEPSYGRVFRTELGDIMGPRKVEAALVSALSFAFRSFWKNAHPAIRDWLELWAAPWDLTNLKILLRSRGSPRPAETTLSRWGARAAFSEKELEALSTSSTPEALVRRVAGKSPLYASAARIIAASWTASSLEMEEKLDHWWGESIEERVSRDGTDGETVGRFLAPRIDARNLLAALRSARDGGAPDLHLLAGGTPDGESLARRVAERPTLERGLEALRGTRFEEIVEGEAPPFGAEQALGRIERALQAFTLRAGALAYARADPLGVGVLVRFLQLEATETSNLLAIARGLEQGLPAGMIERMLVLV